MISSAMISSAMISSAMISSATISSASWIVVRSPAKASSSSGGSGASSGPGPATKASTVGPKRGCADGDASGSGSGSGAGGGGGVGRGGVGSGSKSASGSKSGSGTNIPPSWGPSPPPTGTFPGRFASTSRVPISRGPSNWTRNPVAPMYRITVPQRRIDEPSGRSISTVAGKRSFGSVSDCTGQTFRRRYPSSTDRSVPGSLRSTLYKSSDIYYNPLGSLAPRRV